MSPLPLVISLTYIYIDHLYTHALVQILIIRQTKKTKKHHASNIYRTLSFHIYIMRYIDV